MRVRSKASKSYPGEYDRYRDEDGGYSACLPEKAIKKEKTDEYVTYSPLYYNPLTAKIILRDI